MSVFFEGIGLGIAIGMGFSFLITGIALLIWYFTDEQAREDYKSRMRAKTLTNKEYFSVVFGVLFVALGSAMVTIFATSWSTDEGIIINLIGMYLIISGILLEIRTVTQLKQSITNLGNELLPRIEKLEDKS